MSSTKSIVPELAINLHQLASFCHATWTGRVPSRYGSLKRQSQKFASTRSSQSVSSLSTDRLVYFKQVILQGWSIGGDD
ncbi:hypothetical protein FOFC_19143 [Fusarium oxysporum]|nr:hypothetical protein FOFC_19143 [Fusarium oxysporum]